MANSVHPDQTAAPSGAVWSGFALFAYAILSAVLVNIWSYLTIESVTFKDVSAKKK